MTNVIVSTTPNSSLTPPQSTIGDPSSSAIGEINELMVRLGSLFSKMRDILRQYNQTQQSQLFKIQTNSYHTKLQAIEKNFESANLSAIGEIVAGSVQAIGAGVGVAKENSSFSSFGSGMGEAAKGGFNLGANALSREGQELSAQADYQSGLADALLKRSDAVLEKALKASADLKDLMSMLTQVHERLASMR